MINKKILLLTNIPTPYRIPLYNYLSRVIINFEVWFFAKSEKNRNWIINENIIFNHKFLNCTKIQLIKGHFTLYLKNIKKNLIKYSPDIIIVTGYDSPIYWQAVNYAKKNNKKTIMVNGSTYIFSKLKTGLAYKIKKMFISKIDSFVTYGSKATEYLEYFNVNKNKIITGLNTIDVDWFIKKSQLIIKSDKYKLAKIKYTGKKKLLYIGRLIKYKGLDKLLETIKLLKNPDLHLFIIGTGPDEQYFKTITKKLGLTNQVDFIGYIQKNHIPFYYCLCDYFIFPTLLEPWGLVINEALSCGIPVLSSIYAGATYDLVFDNINGSRFDPKNQNDFLIKLNMLLKHKFNHIIIRNSIKNKGINNYGKIFIDAIKLLK